MNLGKKIILVIIFVVFYFFLLRPVRSGVIEIINSNIELVVGNVTSSSSTGIKINYEKEDFSKKFSFKSPFGMFFLLSTVCLIFMGSDWKKLGLLSILHLCLWILAFGCFLIGSKGSVFFLQTMDFLIRYLIPLCTLGYPLYLIIESKMESTS